MKEFPEKLKGSTAVTESTKRALKYSKYFTFDFFLTSTNGPYFLTQIKELWKMKNAMLSMFTFQVSFVEGFLRSTKFLFYAVDQIS